MVTLFSQIFMPELCSISVDFFYRFSFFAKNKFFSFHWKLIFRFIFLSKLFPSHAVSYVCDFPVCLWRSKKFLIFTRNFWFAENVLQSAPLCVISVLYFIFPSFETMHSRGEFKSFMYDLERKESFLPFFPTVVSNMMNLAKVGRKRGFVEGIWKWKGVNRNSGGQNIV